MCQTTECLRGQRQKCIDFICIDADALISIINLASLKNSDMVDSFSCDVDIMVTHFHEILIYAVTEKFISNVP